MDHLQKDVAQKGVYLTRFELMNDIAYRNSRDTCHSCGFQACLDLQTYSSLNAQLLANVRLCSCQNWLCWNPWNSRAGNAFYG